jgi:phage-related protein|tara:strand:+ start:2875 stop:3363 length:489 start_codon:yes stop_codon:yes gene_type:complete
MRTLPSALITAKNDLASADSWIALFEIIIDDGTNHYYIAAYDAQVTFDGQTYEPYPIALNRIEEDTDGTLSEVTITLSLLGAGIAELIDDNDGLAGVKVFVRFVQSANLADTTAKIETELEVIDCTGDLKSASFRCGFPNLLRQQAPSKRYNRLDFPAIVRS